MLGFIEVHGGEQLFTHVCAPKKAHSPAEHSGKFRECWGQFSQKFSKLVCFSIHLPELSFQMRVALQVDEFQLQHRGGASWTSTEKGSANILKVIL